MARAGLTRRAVVEAAASLVSERGMHDLTLARLATELGVRSPSLYKHIASLDDVRAAVAGLAGLALGEGLQHAALGLSGEAAVRAVAHSLRRWARANPRLYEVTLLSHIHLPPDARQALDRALVVVLGAFSDLGLEGDEVVHAARAFRSAVHGFVHLESQGGFGLPTDADASFDRLLGILLSGVESQSPIVSRSSATTSANPPT